jgi:hypothetical protein
VIKKAWICILVGVKHWIWISKCPLELELLFVFADFQSISNLDVKKVEKGTKILNNIYIFWKNVMG